MVCLEQWEKLKTSQPHVQNTWFLSKRVYILNIGFNGDGKSSTSVRIINRFIGYVFLKHFTFYTLLNLVVFLYRPPHTQYAYLAQRMDFYTTL